MRRFHGEREYVEAKLVDLAAHSGKPRGLTWVRCDFEDDVAYVREKKTGQLSALVGVTIGFGHCIGMCGGIVVAYSSTKMDHRSSYIQQTASHLAYNFGRVTTYTILGGIFGFAGQVNCLD